MRLKVFKNRICMGNLSLWNQIGGVGICMAVLSFRHYATHWFLLLQLAVALKECVEAGKGLFFLSFFFFLFFLIILSFIWKHIFPSLLLWLQMLYTVIFFIYWSTWSGWHQKSLGVLGPCRWALHISYKFCVKRNSRKEYLVHWTSWTGFRCIYWII